MTRADEVPQRRKPTSLRVRAEAAEIGQSTLRQNGIFRAAGEVVPTFTMRHPPRFRVQAKARRKHCLSFESLRAPTRRASTSEPEEIVPLRLSITTSSRLSSLLLL